MQRFYFRPKGASAPCANTLYGQAFFWIVTAAALAAGTAFVGGTTGSFFAATFQSFGGLAMPHTFPCVYSATPTRNCFPSLPSGKQFATRPVTLPPPGRSLIRSGVSS